MDDFRWSKQNESVDFEEIDAAVVAYDRSRDEVLCISGEAATVLRACDNATLAELSSASGLEPDQVSALLADLADRGLVRSSADPSLARRSLTRGAIGMVGAAAIWSITAPTPAAAASNGDNGNN